MIPMRGSTAYCGTNPTNGESSMAVRLNKCDREAIEKCKATLHDDRAKWELEDFTRCLEYGRDEDGFETTFAKLDDILETIEALLAYERGFEGNDYWHEQYWCNFEKKIKRYVLDDESVHSDTP